MTLVTSVTPLEGHRLRVEFADGLVREVNLADRLRGPMFEPLRDERYFRRVFVDPDTRTVAWPNGLDLDPDVLHGDAVPVAPA